jgi:hypothetical protein
LRETRRELLALGDVDGMNAIRSLTSNIMETFQPFGVFQV